MPTMIIDRIEEKVLWHWSKVALPSLQDHIHDSEAMLLQKALNFFLEPLRTIPAIEMEGKVCEKNALVPRLDLMSRTEK
jgi:hypothetical protein